MDRGLLYKNSMYEGIDAEVFINPCEAFLLVFLRFFLE